MRCEDELRHYATLLNDALVDPKGQMSARAVAWNAGALTALRWALLEEGTDAPEPVTGFSNSRVAAGMRP